MKLQKETDMEPMETISGRRFLRYDEILQWIIEDEMQGKGFRSIEELDWTLLAAISQHLFQKHINNQPEAAEEIILQAEAQAEADLYFSLAYAINKIKKRFKRNTLITLTEVIDFLRDRQVITVGPLEVDLSLFFSSSEYELIEKYRQVTRRNAIRTQRAYAALEMIRPLANRWTERCDENRERLSRLALACLSTAALGILAPTLLWHDGELLDGIYDETEKFLAGKEKLDYGGLLQPILELRLRDGTADIIMHGKHEIGQKHRKIWCELYDAGL